MKKISTLFMRDFENNPRYVTEEVNPDSKWVIDGEGVATRKYDGTCCAIIDGLFVKRNEVKKDKPEPYGFILADHDLTTGKKQGWLEVGNDNEDKYHREGYESLEDKSDGTFELVGPKVQGNPEKYLGHELVRHSDAETYLDAPRSYSDLKEFLKDKEIEGLVWHHPDGRMAKLKRKDLGL
jgi:hypothetical protein